MTNITKVVIPKESRSKGKGGAAVVNNKTEVSKCTCQNAYQDTIYGMGMRVKNSCTNGTRCTVCGSK